MRAGDTDKSRWIAGVFYMDYQNMGKQNVLFGSRWIRRGQRPLPSPYQDIIWDMHTKTWAVFGQYEYDITDRLTGVLGARYGSEDKRFEATWVSELGNPADALDFTKAAVGDLTKFDKSNTSYNARLNYHVTEDLLTYVGAARAYKAGTLTSVCFVGGH